MRSGLYALASRDGRPLDSADCIALNLPAPNDENAPFVFAGLDAPGSGAIEMHRWANGTDVLAGFLDEPDDLAAALGCGADTPHVVMTGLALDRFGAAAPSRLLGEWSFLRWNEAERAFILMASENCRDALFYTIDRGRVAVAPDVRVLSGLPAIGRKLDVEGTLLNMGRAQLRAGLTDQTMVAGVKRVVQGTIVTITPTGVTATTPVTPPDPTAWRGSFGDAMAEIEHVLLRIMRQTLARHRQPAFQLSGGLDSSLLGYLGTRTLAPGQSMRFLSSAAAPGSGIEDETHYAALVADALGVPLERVVPRAEASIYRPSLRSMLRASGPILTPAHFLYEALYDAALSHGADLLLDGVIGEATVSSPQPVATRGLLLRMFARAARNRLLGRAMHDDTEWIAARERRYHPRLAPALLASPLPSIDEIWTRPFAPFDPDKMLRPNDLLGRSRTLRKAAVLPTEAVDQALRIATPYRDSRLVELVAGMPASVIQRNGVGRAPARLLMRGHVPPAVTERNSGMPFAPDTDHRIVAHAPEARQRVPLFRAAGLDTWLDLEWLTTSLDEIIEGKPKTLLQNHEIVLTACTAEHLLWWHTT